MNSVLIFLLNKERKGYCSNKREGFSSFLLKYCVHFLEPQFCSKINWTATYTWILDLAKTVLSFCWNKVNDISYIFFFSANITSRFLWLQVAMIPQVSESIFNVENSVVVPASCIFKNSINKMRIWFLDTIRPLSLLPHHMYKEQRKQNVSMIPVVISYSSSFNLAFFFFLLSSSSSFSSILLLLSNLYFLFHLHLNSTCSEIECSIFFNTRLSYSSSLPVLLSSCLHLLLFLLLSSLISSSSFFFFRK